MNTSENVKISVIMPVYNRANVLQKAVQSVLSQTLREIELICINDGSTDDSVFVIQKLRKKDPRVRLLSQRNTGAGPARNYGLRKARGEFVAFLDSDDWYASDRVLEKLYTKAVENHVKVCIGGSRKAKLGKLLPLEKPGKVYFTKERLYSFREYQFSHGYWRGIYERKMILDNHICFPAYRRFQDPPFFVKTMTCAKQFYAVTDIILIYDESDNYQKIVWNEEKVTDLLRGARDILQIARAESYIELQRYFIERIRRGDWKPIFSENLSPNWIEAKSLMEEINTYFLEDAMRQEGMSEREKPFDEILNKVYGNHVYAMKRIFFKCFRGYAEKITTLLK